jgi:hypothetical protein
MLNKIDKLFACQVGHYIPLPQIVVVGYQSSGKSSILARITGLPFPRKSGFCTRFATQITFRRQAARCITVSIVPGKGSSQEHADRVRTWGKELETLDELSFIAIMKEVVRRRPLFVVVLTYNTLTTLWISKMSSSKLSPTMSCS